MLTGIELGAVLAPLLSAFGVVVLYHYLGRDYLGADENKLWNNFRRGLLLSLNDLVQRETPFKLTNNAKESETVGTVDRSSQEVASLFESGGFLQGVLSGLKGRVRDGEDEWEDGSMVYREAKSDLIPDALALYQLHVFWFENDDGTTDVYAHYEYSSLNPLVAWKHYRAVGQDAEEGVRRVKSMFPTLEGE